MKPGGSRGEWLSKWERFGLWSLVAVTILFGAMVEWRSAFMFTRKTDADDFFRAAWAIRTGVDIYTITDTQGWHYNYPAFFAILLTPLANPPPGADRARMLPYPVSIAIWYALSVVFLAVAVHWLASALERAAPSLGSPLLWSRRWWLLRLLPFYVCIISIGRTLSRGQSNTLVLLCFCGMAALMLQGRRVLSGLCLAGAICIKVYPAFLLLHPASRRDFRCIAGCIAGLVLGIIVVPVIAIGPARTFDGLRRYAQVTLLPGLGLGTDTTRADELTTATATDSQAFGVVLHNFLYPNPYKRPKDSAAWERIVHWIIVVTLTGLTLWIGRKSRGDAVAEVLFLGALIVIMLPSSPVCHLHYFIFALPLVMALVADAWERHSGPVLGAKLATLFVLNVGLNLLTALQTLASFKEFGVSLYPILALWAAGLMALSRRANSRNGLDAIVPHLIPAS